MNYHIIEIIVEPVIHLRFYHVSSFGIYDILNSGSAWQNNDIFSALFSDLPFLLYKWYEDQLQEMIY